MIRRGALLLEVLLSLALFVMAGLTILTIVGDAIARLDDSRERLEAADLAHSAMAAIEAGLYDVNTLSGPVPEGGLFNDDDLDSGGIDMSPELGDTWSLEIETDRSDFEGLSLVSISVLREAPSAGIAMGFDADAGPKGPVYTLVQLVAVDAERAPAEGRPE